MKRFMSKSITVVVLFCFLHITVFYPNGVFAGYPSIESDVYMKEAASGSSGVCYEEGDCPDCARSIGAVGYFTGSELVNEVDLVIPGRGIPLVISRNYNSKGIYNSFYGYGWDLSVNVRLYKTEQENYKLRLGRGTINTFKYDWASGEHKSPPGLFLSIDESAPTWAAIITTKDGLKYYFDELGLLKKLEDRNGNAITYFYDTDGETTPQKFAIHGLSPDAVDPETPIVMVMDYRLSRIVDTVGREINFSYYSSGSNMGKLYQIFYQDQAAGGNAYITYEYDDTYGNLTTIIDQAGLRHSYSYEDPNDIHNLTHVYNVNGDLINYREYDEYDRVVKEIYEDGSYERFWYGAPVAGATSSCSLEFAGNPRGTALDVIHRTRRGALEILGFDIKGNLVDRTNTMGTLGNPDDDITERYGTNAERLPIFTVDGLGRITGFSWNEEGDLIMVAKPQVNEISYLYYEDASDYTYSPANYHRIKEIDAPDGYQDMFFEYYDEDVSIVNVGGPVAAHNLKSIKRGYRDSTHDVPHFQTVATFEYDANGQVTRVRNALGKEVEFQYDALANLTKLISPKNSDAGQNPYIDFTNYDNMGRLKELQDPTGISASLEYDSLGRVLSQTVTPSGGGTALGSSLVYNDTASNAVSTDVNGIDNTVEWDKQGNITSSALTLTGGGGDGVPNTVSFTPDISGAPASLTDPAGFVNDFGYDALDRLSSLTRPNGDVTSYVNDKASQLFRVDRPDGSAISYRYDALGRLASRSETSSGEFASINYTGSEVTFVVYGDGSGSKTITYAYDSLYRLQTVTYPTGDYVEYVYDDADRVTSVVSSSGDTISYDHYDDGSVKTVSKNGSVVATYTYTQSGQVDTLTRDNGTVTDYDYDTFGRLSRIAHMDGAVPFLSFDYTYDSGTRNSMMITGITRTESGVSETTSYDYDDLYRLKSVTDDDGTVRTYSYDQNGNILGMEERDVSAVLLRSEVYNYYSDTDPVHGKMNRVASINYDDNGNTVIDRTRLFDYDGRGNVILDDRGMEAFAYTYNSRNQISSVQKDAGSGFQWLASYEYDAFGRRTAKETSAGREEFTYSGIDILHTKLNGVLSETYVHGDGIDDIILSEGNGGAMKYAYTDHLGSVVGIDDGGSRDLWEYDEWGVAYSDRPSDIFRYGYISRELDEETSLTFIRARTYDPSIRRWYQQEPLGFAGDWNFYAYAGNNPVFYVDPFGLFSLKSFGKGVLKGTVYIVGGVAISAAIALTLPATAATFTIAGLGIIGAAALGVGIGEAITGQQIGFCKGKLMTETLSEEERSELIGESVVGVAAIAFAAVKIKNILVDKPSGKFGPHIHYGPANPKSVNIRQPFGRPKNHFGPLRSKHGPGSWKGWSEWFSNGPDWTFKE